MGFDRFFGFDLIQRKTLEKLLADASGSDAATLAAHTTSITNLNAWAAALATKLNADAGVTDTNYDTNPQA
jgi:hypothetical protein